MRRRCRGSRVAAVFVAMLLATGCAAAVRRPAQAPEVRLVSSSAFRLHATVREVEACTVTVALLRVSAVRGDTIFFQSATAKGWPYGATRCGFDSPGYVPVADHPELMVARLEPAPRWVRALALPVGLLVVPGFFVALLIGGSFLP